jgi:hypothetical protein
VQRKSIGMIEFEMKVNHERISTVLVVLREQILVLSYAVGRASPWTVESKMERGRMIN